MCPGPGAPVLYNLGGRPYPGRAGPGRLTYRHVRRAAWRRRVRRRLVAANDCSTRVPRRSGRRARTRPRRLTAPTHCDSTQGMSISSHHSASFDAASGIPFALRWYDGRRMLRTSRSSFAHCVVGNGSAR